MPCDGRSANNPITIAGPRMLPPAAVGFSSVDYEGLLVLRLTVGTDTNINPVICCYRNPRSCAASAWAEISVASWIPRTLCLNPISGWLLARSKLSTFCFPHDDGSKVQKLSEEVSSFVSLGVESCVCSVLPTSLHPFYVKQVLNCKPHVSQWLAGRYRVDQSGGYGNHYLSNFVRKPDTIIPIVQKSEKILRKDNRGRVTYLVITETGLEGDGKPH